MALKFVISILCVLTFAPIASAQPGSRELDLKSRVLDLLFRPDVLPKPYFTKLALRFGDSNTQLVVVIYPGEKSEVIRYSLESVLPGELARQIDSATRQDPRVTPETFAAKLKVNVSKSAIDYRIIKDAIERLRRIKLSPVLASRVALDNYSEFELWYNTWQEAVHFTVVGPYQSEPQDELSKWMLTFRAEIEKATKNR